jgi:hypothetical protein
MLQWLYTYVLSVGFKYFICFRHMLQVFHLDVAKVDLDIAYICKCFKCFHMYSLHIGFRSRLGRDCAYQGVIN